VTQGIASALVEVECLWVVVPLGKLIADR